MRYAITLIFLLFGLVNSVLGFDVEVLRANGKPLAGALVSLHGEGMVLPESQHIELNQRELRFDPQITLVPLGSTVVFTNEDKVTHHVYSFSKPWREQFRLKKGEIRNAVMGTAGEVALGCNIHDWMLAYIYVLDTSLYGLTDEDGHIQFSAIPSQALTLKIRHPRIRDGRGAVSQVLSTELREENRVTIKLKRKLLPKRDQIPTDDDEYLY